MSTLAVAEQTLRDGDPAGALKLLQDEVRARPADAKLRIFLFQLLCVLGQWERALSQLDVAAQLDASALPMQQTYREAIRCELLRAQVFAGQRSPMVFGEPQQWLALLIEALLLEGHGEAAQGRAMRARGFEEAEATPGSADGQAFEWIADADSRIGPVLEAVVNGRYYWIPFVRLNRMVIEPPNDLRDYVWAPAHLEFANGGESVALIPTRYVGSEAAEDGLVRLGRKTTWEEPADGLYVGLGQRLFATDVADFALLDLREVVFGREAPAGTE